MGNMIAYGALLIWPLVSLILYLTLPAGRATIWTILGGYLLLPVVTAFDFPGIPPFNKYSVPTLCAMLLAPIMARRGEFRWPTSTTVNLLIALYVLMPFATGFNNTAPINVGSVSIPGMGFKECLRAAFENFLDVGPFILGAGLLGTERGHRDIMLAFVTAALVYTVPILAEIRLSPFLQQKLYGVMQFGYFQQQMRDGGFRSIVFLGHGLLVSTFLAMSLIAAVGLRRMRTRIFGVSAALVALYLGVVLVLNKSVGAIILAAIFVPMVYWMRPRRLFTVSLVLASMITLYPALRGANLIPVDTVTRAISHVSAERAHSWSFRLKNEDMLLARAREKPVFGWGIYGRNRVLILTDWGDTKDVSPTDGTWIILVGMYGWVGYIAGFGLLTYPFWRGFRLRGRAMPIATTTLMMMHLLNLLDLIPNSSLRPITWVVAGALANMAAVSARRVSRPRAEQAPPMTPALQG